MASIQDMTPIEIDTILSGLWAKQQKGQHRVEVLRQTKADILADGNNARRTGWTKRTARDGVRLCDDLADAIEDLANLNAESLPYENEYVRRGAWSRYFLVQDTDGHIHRSMHCQTCNREGRPTRFSWLIELSGKDERDLTDEVGPNACTVCFPWAETIRAEFDAETRQIKADAKAAEKAEKARIAAEKGITTPEGDKLYAGKENASYDVCKSLRTAEIAATDALVDLIDVQRQSADPEFEWLFQNGRTVEKRTMEITRHTWCLIRSIAAKKGQTFEETFQVHEKKAQAKVRKQDREWAKDTRNPNRVTK
jgi:hypothetical protein